MDSMKQCFKRQATELCQKVANFSTLKELVDEWSGYDYVTKQPIPAILSLMVRE